jgi:hypothetical protein
MTPEELEEKKGEVARLLESDHRSDWVEADKLQKEIDAATHKAAAPGGTDHE